MSEFSSSYFKSNFGSELISKKERVNIDVALNSKKVIGIYFSAHWCGPCRGFTPLLSSWYNDFKQNHANGMELEIIFVSSDRDNTSFDEYFAEMPWLALPFEARDLKAKLSSQFGVKGIPTLVFLTDQGEIITKNGRDIVSRDPTGANYPWKPKSIAETLGTEFVSFGEKKTITNDIVMIYFSAHWCPPCRKFTPVLSEYYKKHSASKGFDIVFVSGDQDQSSFEEYLSEMPWIAVPFGDNRSEELNNLFEVEGIPHLVILNKATGKIINNNGRGAVESDPDGLNFPYFPQPVEDLAGGESYGCDVNDKPAFILFMEGMDDSEQANAKDLMLPLAKKHAQEMVDTKGSPDMIFFTAVTSSRLSDIIRDKASLVAAKLATKPTFVILDIPNGADVYSCEVDEVTSENLTEFIQGYFNKTLTASKLKR